MISTEETVTAALVERFKDIAERDLGFDTVSINIKDYLLDHEQRERFTKYLRASSGGKQILRAVAVHSTGTDNFYALGNVNERIYQITIQQYQDVGINGEGVKTLLRHHRKLLQAIRAAGITLDGTVTKVNRIGELDIARIPTESADIGEMLVGTFTIEAFKSNPDY